MRGVPSFLDISVYLDRCSVVDVYAVRNQIDSIKNIGLTNMAIIERKMSWRARSNWVQISHG